mgnify:CR=1 FL=1|jgi:hypothetical protein
MANEIRASADLVVDNGNSKTLRTVSNLFDQTTQNVHVDTVTVTSTAGNLTTGTISTLGWFWGQNISSNKETIYLGTNVSSTFFSNAKLNAGEIAMFRAEPGSALMAKTDTNNGTLTYMLCEN